MDHWLSRDPLNESVLLPPLFWLASLALSNSGISANYRLALEICHRRNIGYATNGLARNPSVQATYAALQYSMLDFDNPESYKKIIMIPSLPKWDRADVRSLYAAVATRYLAGKDLSEGIFDRKYELIEYLDGCQSPEGGFGAIPGAEAHAGFTFCAVASLVMLGGVINRKAELKIWLSRRVANINGRPSKQSDSCYIWWSVASWILCGFIIDEIDTGHIIEFLNRCVSLEGGFSIRPGETPDIFHSFIAQCSRGLLLGSIDPRFAMPKDVIQKFIDT
jgi:Prenyltransferase and squalene oxidase repeat